MRPPHCPFCLSLGPQFLVEVKSTSAIKQRTPRSAVLTAGSADG
jgi:hypothetical protein